MLQPDLPDLQAGCALSVFLVALAPELIIGAALAWAWPLFLGLLGSDGLPGNALGCRDFNPNHKVVAATLPRGLSAAIVCTRTSTFKQPPRVNKQG
jgi:hypothetical protein